MKNLTITFSQEEIRTIDVALRYMRANYSGSPLKVITVNRIKNLKKAFNTIQLTKEQKNSVALDVTDINLND